ncbi:MAG TPA: efflux RND transporter periplasmic adaptor subunit [Vicinamibacterales bacterium]|nr:efflux RND transporter periplasmic adaptor subunit [Vicinamibacterales bacterium]
MSATSRLTVTLLPLALSALACGGTEGAPAGAGGPGGMPPAEVKTITLAPRPVPRTSEFVATVQSLASTTIQPQVEGIVTRIFVKSGDRVRVGQPLVQIDPDKQQASVATLEAARAARQADVAFARQQLDRMQKLFEAGAVSRQELEQAQTARQTAEAQLAAIEQQIRESRVELQYYRVTAPSAGVIGDIPIRHGDRVTPAAVITTIDQAQGLEAYINVPLEQAAELRTGLAVELLDADGKVIASNPITFVAPRADDSTQSVLVKAQLRNRPPGLRVMQYLRARVVWSNEPQLTVPVVAVNRMAGQYFVFVAEQGQQGTVARQKPVTVGEIVGDDYVVRRGLKPGERVIVSNVQKIGDGAPVKAS